MNREDKNLFHSKQRSLLHLLDIFWLGLSGRLVDVDHGLSSNPARKPLSTSGTIKIEASLLPGLDRRIEKIAKQYGGWKHIIGKDFVPPEKLYFDLESVGFSHEQLDRARAYKASPTAVR